jgi:hypothetical protein
LENITQFKNKSYHLIAKALHMGQIMYIQRCAYSIATWEQGAHAQPVAMHSLAFLSHGDKTMSNSSRIEAATRGHIGAVLTSDQIHELVKLSDPTSTKGVYPSDCAGKRLEDGTIVHRGKVQYGDLVLEYLKENSFKVLPTEQIVRLPGRKPAKAASTVPAPTPTPIEVPVKKPKKGKKASKSASRIPVAPNKKANHTHVS